MPEQYVTTEGVELALNPTEDSTLPVGTIVDKGKNISGDLPIGTRIIFRKYAPEKVFLYDDEGRLIPNMIVIKLEDVLGYDDGKGAQSLPKEKDA